ncbi:MAG: hypothetical protein JWP58_774, partial [Hymenobacter sp.]|nr:hypothetical protein [Hymenobacter sp.]
MADKPVCPENRLSAIAETGFRRVNQPV